MNWGNGGDDLADLLKGRAVRSRNKLEYAEYNFRNIGELDEDLARDFRV